MAPDPPAYPIDESLPHNFNPPLAVPNSDDSDNEFEEQQAYDGYTLLGQHELIAGPTVNNNDDSVRQLCLQTNIFSQGESGFPPELTAGRAELAALWNNTPVGDSSNGIAMDDERSDQIKAAMAGFSLPPSAVPAWASNIPEELWKERLLGRLHQSTSKTGQSK
ncbi:hypothetical protein ONE63_008247 [Megalurothrips usitatus]|uniref:Male-enhanced antigen 1 n=1 Tax=Megalurothrips usitatus TaxID=439358 RepID=A0AAV7XS47_9NEOP|nr:hypothetical protein ONE63_008247 [Megalurothrips usitatus]